MKAAQIPNHLVEESHLLTRDTCIKPLHQKWILNAIKPLKYWGVLQQQAIPLYTPGCFFCSILGSHSLTPHSLIHLFLHQTLARVPGFVLGAEETNIKKSKLIPIGPAFRGLTAY